MNSDQVQEDFEDTPFAEEIGDPPYETNVYPGRLVGFKRGPKPDWKQKKERERNIAEGKPDKEVDPEQWCWKFQFFDCDYEGQCIEDFTSRTFHVNSTAGKHAAALLGMEAYQEPEGGTAILAGKPALIHVTAKRDKSYVDKLSIYKPRKASKNGAKPIEAEVLVGSEIAEALEARSVEAQFKAVWNELKGVGWSQAELLAACKDVVPDFALFGKLTTPEQEAIVAALHKLDRVDDASDLPF